MLWRAIARNDWALAHEALEPVRLTTNAEGGGMVRFKEILAHVESRLGQLPIFRQRILRVPLDLDYPYWIEDESFDIEYHVRHIALPKPGDWRQFCIQASRIHARPLDLKRPLWEMYVIEGLDTFLDLPVGSFAVLLKIHHAAIDVADLRRRAELVARFPPLGLVHGTVGIHRQRFLGPRNRYFRRRVFRRESADNFDSVFRSQFAFLCLRIGSPQRR